MYRRGVVSDSSVLIDLERGAFLIKTFARTLGDEAREANARWTRTAQSQDTGYGPNRK